MSFRPRIAAITIGLVVTLGSVSGCSSPTTVDVYAWTADSDQATTLTLTVLTGADDKLLSGEVVSESSTQVVVAAKTHVAGGSHTANGLFQTTTVDLQDPIGTRTVVNRDGTEVPRQK